MLERPKLVEEETMEMKEEKESFVITKEKVITALAMVNYTYFSVPHD